MTLKVAKFAFNTVLTCLSGFLDTLVTSPLRLTPDGPDFMLLCSSATAFAALQLLPLYDQNNFDPFWLTVLGRLKLYMYCILFDQDGDGVG